MSQYVLIAGVACVAVGHILTAVSTVISAVKGNQAKDPTMKGSLRAAAGFLGISILLGTVALVSGMVLAGTKGCSKKNKIVFLIFLALFAISYIIALVIIVIYRNRLAKAGDTAGARDLNAAFIMPLVAAGLYILGFILIFAVLGRRLRRLAKACDKGKKASGKNF